MKRYFRVTSYNGWPIVWCHSEQLCLSSRRRFTSLQSALSFSSVLDVPPSQWLSFHCDLQSSVSIFCIKIQDGRSTRVRIACALCPVSG